MEVLSKSPQLKVLTILAQRPQEELTKTEIAQRAGIGRTTLYRVWNDLERMKAVSPSRHVGAVTLYRMNPQSPVVQSFLSITKSLTTVTDAVARIEQLRKLEDSARTEFGQGVPPGPNVLMKLLQSNATSAENAKKRSEMQFIHAEADALEERVTVPKPTRHPDSSGRCKNLASRKFTVTRSSNLHCPNRAQSHQPRN
jgi:Fe2+ or Zn2+ uptake regulation protein